MVASDGGRTERAIVNAPASLDQIRTFIEHEAALLDARAYREWLALFTDDGRYWLPIDPAARDPRQQLNLIYDRRDQLGDRVERLLGGRMHAEAPASRVARILSGVRLETEGAVEPVARSTFVLVAQRKGVQRVLAGHAAHRLRILDGTLRLVEKRVDLINSQEALEDLSFIP